MSCNRKSRCDIRNPSHPCDKPWYRVPKPKNCCPEVTDRVKKLEDEAELIETTIGLLIAPQSSVVALHSEETTIAAKLRKTRQRQLQQEEEKEKEEEEKEKEEEKEEEEEEEKEENEKEEQNVDKNIDEEEKVIESRQIRAPDPNDILVTLFRDGHLLASSEKNIWGVPNDAYYINNRTGSTPLPPTVPPPLDTIIQFEKGFYVVPLSGRYALTVNLNCIFNLPSGGDLPGDPSDLNPRFDLVRLDTNPDEFLNNYVIENGTIVAMNTETLLSSSVNNFSAGSESTDNVWNHVAIVGDINLKQGDVLAVQYRINNSDETESNLPTLDFYNYGASSSDGFESEVNDILFAYSTWSLKMQFIEGLPSLVQGIQQQQSI